MVRARLRGLVLTAEDKAAIASAGVVVGGPVSAAPPIIPVAAKRPAGADNSQRASSDRPSSGLPLLWIAAALLILLLWLEWWHQSVGSWLADLSGGLDLLGPSSSGPPACATEMDCGPHGTVLVHSPADRGEYCSCDCDDGFTGEDCT